MIKCNSIIFVRDACNFLGIEMDSAALDLQDLLETKYDLTSFLFKSMQDLLVYLNQRGLLAKATYW